MYDIWLTQIRLVHSANCAISSYNHDLRVTGVILGLSIFLGSVLLLPIELPKPGDAVRLDVSNPYRWCDLGESLRDSGDIETARKCMLRAAELAPRVPPVLIRAANFHLVLGEPRAALPYMRQVLDLVPDYNSIIFLLFERTRLGLEELLARGVPVKEDTAQAFFRHLLARVDRPDAAKGWAWLEGHKFADDKIAGEYVQYLIQKKEYETAAGLWAGYLGERRGTYRRAELIFNPRWQSQPTECPFDWRITPVAGVEVARRAFGGLRVVFEGKQNIDYGHISQLVVAAPGRHRFRAEFSAVEITTNEGPYFRVYDAENPERLDVETEMSLGTRTGGRLELTFAVPKGTRLLGVQLRRRPSGKFDNKIKGMLELHAVSLVPAHFQN